MKSKNIAYLFTTVFLALYAYYIISCSGDVMDGTDNWYHYGEIRESIENSMIINKYPAGNSATITVSVLVSKMTGLGTTIVGKYITATISMILLILAVHLLIFSDLIDKNERHGVFILSLILIFILNKVYLIGPNSLILGTTLCYLNLAILVHAVEKRTINLWIIFAFSLIILISQHILSTYFFILYSLGIIMIFILKEDLLTKYKIKFGISLVILSTLFLSWYFYIPIIIPLKNIIALLVQIPFKETSISGGTLSTIPGNLLEFILNRFIDEIYLYGIAIVGCVFIFMDYLRTKKIEYKIAMMSWPIMMILSGFAGLISISILYPTRHFQYDIPIIILASYTIIKIVSLMKEKLHIRNFYNIFIVILIISGFVITHNVIRNEQGYFAKQEFSSEEHYANIWIQKNTISNSLISNDQVRSEFIRIVSRRQIHSWTGYRDLYFARNESELYQLISRNPLINYIYLSENMITNGVHFGDKAKAVEFIPKDTISLYETSKFLDKVYTNGDTTLYYVAR